MQETTKRPTSGRGTGLTLLMWGFLFFAFAAYCDFTDWPLWLFRGVGFVCLLTGAALFGASFEKAREG